MQQGRLRKINKIRKLDRKIRKLDRKMEKLVNESKLIYFANIFDEDIIVEIKLGKIYEVNTYAGETGDIVCKFTSELESIVIDDDWIHKEDYPNGFITKLTFKNGVVIYEPQYDRDAIDISEVNLEHCKE